mmetsp:Transcript_21002/g.39931  ORF Transcript_21002/g.39931 Transcript_21002/m.39931 type:complete len:219 (-) Transcript_21002:633-1289(-)
MDMAKELHIRHSCLRAIFYETVEEGQLQGISTFGYSQLQKCTSLSSHFIQHSVQLCHRHTPLLRHLCGGAHHRRQVRHAEELAHKLVRHLPPHPEEELQAVFAQVHPRGIKLLARQRECRGQGPRARVLAVLRQVVHGEHARVDARHDEGGGEREEGGGPPHAQVRRRLRAQQHALLSRQRVQGEQLQRLGQNELARGAGGGAELAVGVERVDAHRRH